MRRLVFTSAVFLLSVAAGVAQSHNFRGEYWVTDSSEVHVTEVDTFRQRTDVTTMFRVPIVYHDQVYPSRYFDIYFWDHADSLMMQIYTQNGATINEVGTLGPHAPVTDSVVRFPRSPNPAVSGYTVFVLHGSVLHTYEYECKVAWRCWTTRGPGFCASWVRPRWYYTEPYDDTALMDSILTTPTVAGAYIMATHNFMSIRPGYPGSTTAVRRNLLPIAQLVLSILSQRDGLVVAFAGGPAFVKKISIHDLSGRVLAVKTFAGCAQRFSMPFSGAPTPVVVRVESDKGMFSKLVAPGLQRRR